MASRRPNTANDAGPPRMPFVSAEALLWGPEMKKQHAYLLTEMRALQKQHEGYDARIRAAEAVTEAAVAATTRIRDLEQQLAAIEAKDDDKAFEKWASGEITRLGTLVDTNKNLGQKQIELDLKVSHISENLDRVLHSNVGLEDVLRRLDLLEHDRREDAKRVHSLEREVHNLRSRRESNTLCLMVSRTELKSREPAREELIPAQNLDAEMSAVTIETGNQQALLPQVDIYEEIQVPQSPEVQEINPGNNFTTLPTEGYSTISARQRLLQRPSIHDAKLPRLVDESSAQSSLDEIPGPGLSHTSPPPTQLVFRRHWCNEPVHTPLPVLAPAPILRPVTAPAPAPVPAPVPAPTSTPQHQARPRSRVKTPTCEAPATQLVDRKPPGKRKQPEPGPPTQRQTRSQAKKSQAKGAELEVTTGASACLETQLVQKTEPVSPPRKKLKATPVKQRAGDKTKSNGAGQAAGRNTKKIQDQCKVEESNEHEPIPTKSASSTTRSKRPKATASRKKKPNAARPPTATTNQGGQKRLIVKIRLGQRGQENINAPQDQISASYSYCYDDPEPKQDNITKHI